ncbi:hypothetical protein V8C86DRAFT_2973838 [Haematococcus lacustris]
MGIAGGGWLGSSLPLPLTWAKVGPGGQPRASSYPASGRQPGPGPNPGSEACGGPGQQQGCTRGCAPAGAWGSPPLGPGKGTRTQAVRVAAGASQPSL